jgi:hypothetical protein
MKKVMILLALACMLLFAGCSQTGMDDPRTSPTPDTTQVAEPQDTPTEEQPSDSPGDTAQGDEIQGAQTPLDEQTSEPAEAASASTADDFRIVVEGVVVALGADPAPVFDSFGDGGADASNDYGWIGWTDDSHTHSCYRHDYEDFYIFVTTEEATGISVISRIGLTGIAIAGGVAPGDSYDDMIAQYGEPDAEKTDEGMVDCTYQFTEGTIIFVLNEIDKRIMLIEIQ